jgi:Tfp pilus assembly protein FimT
MSRQKTAFTLVEVILIVLFLGIVAVIAIPIISYSGSSRQKADGVAKKIVTDIRRTRMLAISNAATNPTGFTLKMTGSVPYSGYQIIDDSNGTVVYSQTIASGISCTGSDLYPFGPIGNHRRVRIDMLTISAQGRTYTVSVPYATGVVKCTKLY